jgi:hypothetical protein
MNIRTRNIKRFYYLLHNGSSKDFTYYTNDETYETLTTIHYIGKSDEPVVPTAIDGYNLNKIGMFTFCENKTVTSVTIPNGIIEVE